MNKSVTIFLSAACLFFLSSRVYSQDLEVIFHETSKYDTLNSEIVFDFEIINISTANQTVFEVRSKNQLPQSWFSSLCFGVNCYPPDIDSMVAPDELEPGDTLLSSLHVYPLVNNGTAEVQMQIGTLRNPDIRIIQDFTATTILSDVKDPVQLNEYSLMQNYPNPFNPSTDISFYLRNSSFVTLKVFNLLGQEVASLLNGNLSRGLHSVKFNAAALNSGVYLYRLEAAGIDGSSFKSVKKMMLTK